MDESGKEEEVKRVLMTHAYMLVPGLSKNSFFFWEQKLCRD
jgi:hypothetical protein